MTGSFTEAPNANTMEDHCGQVLNRKKQKKKATEEMSPYYLCRVIQKSERRGSPICLKTATQCGNVFAFSSVIFYFIFLTFEYLAIIGFKFLLSLLNGCQTGTVQHYYSTHVGVKAHILIRSQQGKTLFCYYFFCLVLLV